MSILCRSCGRRNREVARFCDRCGHRLESPSSQAIEPSAEVRHETFFLCDLVDSTRLTTQLDLEDLRTVFSAFRDTVRRIAEQHGGHVHQFMGDGALVSFGYPRMREDGEESAIRAALELVTAIRAARPIAGVELDARIGVASGSVVGGDISTVAAADRSFIVGSVAHLAARLLAMAPAGGVLVAEPTRRRAGNFFTYRDLGAQRLKGFPEPVRVWEVLAETTVASRFDAQHPDRASFPLLGRDAIAADLLTAWDRSRRGDPQAVALCGDAGIGKSRLARLVRDHAREEGATVLEFDCAPSAANTPLQPVLSHLRRAVERPHAPARGREQRLRAWLRRWLGAARASLAFPYIAPLAGGAFERPVSEESPERVRERTMAVLGEIAVAIARRLPVLAIVEDTHWADPTTVALIRALHQQLADAPLMLIATSRLAVAQTSEQLGLRAVAVDSLDSTDAERVIRSVPGGDALPGDVVQRIVQRAEGNPLFLEELSRAMLEGGTRAMDHPIEPADANADVPDVVRLTIAERLDGRPRLKPFAQVASVLGRSFSARLLTEVVPDMREQWHDAAAGLIDLGILAPPDVADAEELRFKHALVQQAVYGTLMRSERRRLHSRVADVLSQQFGDSPAAAPGILAHHYTAAARTDDAARAFGQAARDTGRRAAYLESVGHCRSGLAVVDRVQDAHVASQMKRELLMQLGVSLSATTGYAHDEVQQVYETARGLCVGAASSELLFPIVRGLGTFYFVRGQFIAAAEIAASCIQLARETGRPDFIIEALSFRGYTCVFRGEFADGRAALDECIEAYRAHDGHLMAYPSPQDAGTAAWSLLPIATWMTGDAAGAETAVERALAHAELLGRAFDTAYVHVWIAMLRNMQRRFDDAERHARACIEISQRHGFNTWLLAATMHAGIARACCAPSRDDVATIQGMLALFNQAGAGANTSFFLWGIAQGLRVLGDLESAERAVAEALTRARDSGEAYFEGELLVLRAELTADDVRARDELRQAIEHARRQGAVPVATRAAVALIHRAGAGSLLPAELQAIDSLLPYRDGLITSLEALDLAAGFQQ